ncbi:MAG TPA: HAMP domain-containing sensor histidine kinase, partial [Candidatus Nanopelagicales bacterium]|nr:HAMP domain-containing sensor histidine kinase [Candidatus Nanopelagicales bacterium]
VGLATMLAVGTGLVVTLRELHRDATRAAMADVAQPLVARIRVATAPADLRRRLAELRADLPEDIEAFVLMANGRVLGENAAQLDIASIEIDPALAPGEVVAGSLPDAAGTDFLYAATVLSRGGTATGSRAIVLATQDRSAAAAWRDVTRVLPLVLLLMIILGAPIAWLLSRSITRPLRRLATATADVPSQGAPPLPVEGPREVRQLTERFNAMTAELDATRREEAELLANVRHDLRTPLTVIGGFAQALEDGTAAGDDALRAARAIAEEAGRIERLVDGLGTIEEVRMGRLELRPEPLDAGALVAATIERFAAVAAATGIELGGEQGRIDDGPSSGVIGEPLVLSLTADRAAVERILANLVENALGAAPGPGGHVLVDAHPVRDDHGRAAVALRVSDDGRGFPPGSLDRVFDRFYRADPARSGPGSGLGLAIVRALARAHGGDAVAENLAPTGARVTVTLPVVPPPREVEPPGT